MKKIVALFLLLISLKALAIPPTDWMYLVTKDRFGLIEKTTTYNDLINLFGKEALKEETRSGPEGEGEYKCTVVYGGTELEMVVYWKEKQRHKRLVGVECSQRNSPYHTTDSVKIGSTLTDLVKANKAAIAFYGFGWDYSGLITNYYRGRLEKAKVFFTLGWDGKNDTALLGDGELSSTMPKVIKRAKQVKVAAMRIAFE